MGSSKQFKNKIKRIKQGRKRRDQRTRTIGEADVVFIAKPSIGVCRERERTRGLGVDHVALSQAFIQEGRIGTTNGIGTHFLTQRGTIYVMMEKETGKTRRKNVRAVFLCEAQRESITFPGTGGINHPITLRTAFAGRGPFTCKRGAIRLPSATITRTIIGTAGRVTITLTIWTTSITQIGDFAVWLWGARDI